MTPLPVDAIRDELVAAVQAHAAVLVEAPTGSGKSTRIPPMLLDAGLAGHTGAITVLEPRRLAARMLARRVAAERGTPLGNEIGYQVRMDNHTTPRTRIRYETDGISLRRLHGDPALRDTAILVFDEFHERHLFGDLMLGLALRLQADPRPDLKLVIMSATLDAGALEPMFPDVATVRTEGRTYPVDIRQLAPDARMAALSPWEQAAQVLPGLLKSAPEGDTLIFMPGVYEINRTLDALRPIASRTDRELLPLHGALPADAQDRAAAPAAPGTHRIIVATNIAETSLTIDGVTLVLDSGLVRRAGYDPRRGIGTLLIEKISRASADQRAGRAGRTATGICMRLWTERDHATRLASDPPELLRTDLAETLLHLKQAGVDDPATFPWMTPPPPAAIADASSLLTAIGALTADGALTPAGARMTAFPLHPRMARLLLAGETYGGVPTLCLVAALLQERSILLPASAAGIRDRRAALAGARDGSDFMLLVRAWRHVAERNFDRAAADELGVHAGACRTAGEVRDRLLRIALDQGLDGHDTPLTADALHKAVLTAFPDRLAVHTGGGRCSLTGGRRASLPRDTLADRSHGLFVAADVQEIGRGRGETDVRLGLLAPVQEAWLETCCAATLTEERYVVWDSVAARLIAEHRTLFRDLVIRARRGGEVSDDEAARALADAVLAGRITIKDWDLKVESWIARVNQVAVHSPETGIAGIDDAARRALLEQVCHGLRSAKAVKHAPVQAVLRAWLDPAQAAAVEALAPLQARLENGRHTRIHYDDPAGPYIALRVQDLYDTHRLPTICNGAVPLKVRILAPNMRPVQITDDLAAFWTGSYEQVKKDLRGRYPKHEWR